MPLFGKPDTDKMRSKKDVKGLIKALGYQSDDGVRHYAAKALGEIGDPSAFEPLVKAFQAEKTHWAKLGIIKGLAAYGKPATDVLIAALKDGKFADERGEIAEALGQVNDARAADPLISALQSEKYHGTQVKIIQALATFGEPATDAIMSFLTNEKADVSLAASRALKKIGPPAVPHLVATLSQGDWSTRFNIISALGDIGSPEVVAPLLANLDDKSMRPYAIIALDRIAHILPGEAQQRLAQAQEGEIEERIKSFPESWQNDPGRRAQLLSIVTSPPNSHGQPCPYYFLGVCRMRLISRNDASAGPEKCSLQTGTYTSCFVWRIDPR